MAPTELRVLGALMEKAVTTPEAYPLSLNSLVLACNQKTSRDPVMSLDEAEVTDALDRLRAKRLALRVDVAGSRVPKFRHTIDAAWELSTAEYALLTVLFLRGPQSVGQLRQRTERLHPFPSTDAVENALDAMTDRNSQPYCLVQRLDRLPGAKDPRFTHLFDDPANAAAVANAAANPTPQPLRSVLAQDVDALADRVTHLEAQLNALQLHVNRLRAALE